MQRIFVHTKDSALEKEIASALPAGYSASATIRVLGGRERKPRENHKRRIVIFDIDTVSLATLGELVENNIVIAVTGRRETDLIMETVARGAYEVIHRPVDRKLLHGILADISRLVHELGERIEPQAPHLAPTCAIVGDSPGVIDMCKKLARLSQVDVPVLITGETGTGKELIAESIAQYSARFGKPFVVINCASVPDTLLESELFGFEKGAFSGATASKAGLLRIADEGTIFLDEVAELPLPLQAKLLRFLQTQAFYPIGSTVEIQVNVRVLSATNRDIPAMVRTGTFREDLYHRLCVSSISVPPLRERTNDILPLVRFFIERYRHTAPRPIKGITKAFLDVLVSYRWPGNIRELENVVRSAMAMVKTDYFTTFELKELDRRPAPQAGSLPGEFLATAAAEFIRDALARGDQGLYEKIHNAVDRALLPQVLRHTRENQSEAARLLGINRLTLRKKLGYGTKQRGEEDLFQ